MIERATLALLASFWVSSVSAADPAPIVADASLVQPYSYALQRAEPFRAPYYALFRRGSKELYFVAAAHGTDAESPTFRLIRALVRKHPPQVSIVEGVPADLGLNPPSLTKNYRETSDARIYKWGEAALTALLAVDAGRDYAGSEPSDAEVLRRLKSAGYGVRDLLGFYFLRQIPWMRRGTLEKRPPREVFRDFLRGYPRRLGLKPEELPSYEDFTSWYRAAAGAEFDLDAVEGEALAPLENGTRIQKISAAVDLVRNQSMVETAARMLNSRDRVLVVLGAGHLAMQRRALEAMLGPAVEQSNKAGK